MRDQALDAGEKARAHRGGGVDRECLHRRAQWSRPTGSNGLPARGTPGTASPTDSIDSACTRAADSRPYGAGTLYGRRDGYDPPAKFQIRAKHTTSVHFSRFSVLYSLNKNRKCLHTGRRGRRPLRILSVAPARGITLNRSGRTARSPAGGSARTRCACRRRHISRCSRKC